MSSYRGHEIERRGRAWFYVDTGEPVRSKRERPCGHCRQSRDEHGHDWCFGKLPAVMNACCGHGSESEAYVQLVGGKTLRGAQALRLAALLQQASTSDAAGEGE